MNLAHRLSDTLVKKETQILVVGDAMIDHWVHGRVEPCQDGCRKFMKESSIVSHGGAANAWKCLSRWGVQVRLFGQIYERPEKWRFVDKEGIVFRYDDETKFNIQINSNEVVESVKLSRAVLLSDYDKGYLSPELIWTIADQCALLKIPCVIDVKRSKEFYPSSFVILKGNLEWCRDNGSVEVMTRGHLPPVVRGRTWTGGPEVECVNHVGAGDCFAAHLMLALACGFSIYDAAKLAHSAGRVYVQHEHNYPPSPQEIANDLSVVQ